MHWAFRRGGGRGGGGGSLDKVYCNCGCNCVLQPWLKVRISVRAGEPNSSSSNMGAAPDHVAKSFGDGCRGLGMRARRPPAGGQKSATQAGLMAASSATRLDLLCAGWENMCPCCLHEPDPDGETLARNPKAMPPPAASCDGSAEKKLPPRCTVIVDDDGIRRCTCGKRLSNPDRPFDKGHEPCLLVQEKPQVSHPQRPQHRRLILGDLVALARKEIVPPQSRWAARKRARVPQTSAA